MKYVSVWSNGSNNDDENENEIKLTNQIIIMNISLLQAITIVQLSLEKNDGYYNGARAAIGGVNNHLLFITYPTKNNNTFQFHQLHACNNIKSLSEYAYVRINDVIYALKSVYKYSIRENKLMTLHSRLFGCATILNEKDNDIEILYNW
ncbi:hypothetical protein RFI_32177 [Reticulomyxa filosa]|uniref:Uncharacterized protein n=1 Tax=Reticulomyxa filosa TaxID=46433 RepID=X6LTF3_RETFI|nr:hypothetical protein RFI_32177 [Reticulomyxa filosa]|eukprot:ETO05218.1 hypothetical protein RFI_32177 [Reticulomyxa filosa]